MKTIETLLESELAKWRGEMPDFVQLSDFQRGLECESRRIVITVAEQYAAQFNQWVSCEEQLPEETGMYLVFSGNQRMQVAAYYRGSPFHHEGWDLFQPELVRSWMPLPPTP